VSTRDLDEASARAYGFQDDWDEWVMDMTSSHIARSLLETGDRNRLRIVSATIASTR
jgi:hypothetical protein